jgi:predicted DNA-binding protein with PD1-like motif
MRLCRQPGPPRPAPFDVARCRAAPVRIALPAGTDLLTAAGAWMLDRGCDGAMLTLADVPVTALRYVLPAPSANPAFAAYYSADHVLRGPGRIVQGQMTLGWRDGQPFAHCHALIEDATGQRACGHLRVEGCLLGAGAVATGHAIAGARFIAQPCAETGFTLLTPAAATGAGIPGDAAIVKLSPNHDLHAALVAAARAAGLRDGVLHGLGSLVGAVFANGQDLAGPETEFFFTQARLRDGAADLALTIVDAAGRRLTGRLAPHRTAVLMTVEALILEACDPATGEGPA